MLRTLTAAAALAISVAALGQTTTSPATQQVVLLAPQLVAFSGSRGNLDSLVTGLTSGTPVTLATVGLDGTLQIVTFVPGSALSVVDTARALETARQNLIVRGITTPSAQQIAFALMGGTITTRSGTAVLTGVLTGTTTSPTPVQVRTDSASVLAGATASNLSPTQLQAVRNALATGTAVTVQNVTFTPTGGRLSDFEVNQSLQLAAALLAQQGILNPTADQLRVALFGGGLVGANGSTVAVQGVLQGRVRHTSDSTVLGISASPLTNTSASSLTSTSASPNASTGASPGAGTSASTPRAFVRPAGK